MEVYTDGSGRERVGYTLPVLQRGILVITPVLPSREILNTCLSERRLGTLLWFS